MIDCIHLDHSIIVDGKDFLSNVKSPLPIKISFTSKISILPSLFTSPSKDVLLCIQSLSPLRSVNFVNVLPLSFLNTNNPRGLVVSSWFVKLPEPSINYIQ